MGDYNTIKGQFRDVFGENASVVAVEAGKYRASLPALIVGPERGAQRPLEAFAETADLAERDLISLVLDVASKGALQTSTGQTVQLTASREDLHLSVR